MLLANILLIDKPSGITSFDVIRQLRRKLGVRKMGHAGTLDPLATGLLIIAVGSATKEIGKYMGMPKEYEVLIEFGKISTTYDVQGEISETSWSNSQREAISKEDFEKLIKRDFTGEILQSPPPFSAIKIKGQRAYDLARQGIKVEIPPRKIYIEKIEIIDWNWPFVRLRVNCGKGTYIRSLAHDMGRVLGCGGYVKELRRTAIGNFKAEDASAII